MFAMQIGLEWKKPQKMDDLMQKKNSETLAARTFTLVNAIFAS
jgi:hypothetical protein